MCPALLPGDLDDIAMITTKLYFVLDLNLVLPVIVFFCFDEPHDCFRCMGKDPDRIYSCF